ncbi:MAG: peptide chain release factor N(5)-glutamine methyltransferase [Ruminococcus sp.]|nr:peptide chain release factor N(5)-glutamine methyltransferase [Ruminococcus sp.]MDE7225502.1 peptide chain release factor N(5)-glutamine methyltransferase [Ruminococcus sp.]
MVNRLELYRKCIRELEKNDIPDAEFDTACIFQEALNEKNPLFRPDASVSRSCELRIFSDIEKRCKGIPLQYIIGKWDFWKYTFKVGKGVLIPRPDTETLIENVLDICRKNSLKSPKILDLCAGSGCIAVTLDKEINSSVVYAVEKSENAFRYLEENIRLNNSGVKSVMADVLDVKTAENFRDFDIIVSNPPYLTAEEMTELQTEVRHEPETALYGGTDGFDFYRGITEIWKNSLKKGGYICFEFGMGQHEAVGEILKSHNFKDIIYSRDGGKIIRSAVGKLEE